MKIKTDVLKSIARIIAAPVLILLAGILSVVTVYNHILSGAAEKRAYRLLAESAMTQSVAMDERVRSSFHQLDLIGAGLDWSGDIYSSESVLDDLKGFAAESRFKTLAVAGKDGRMLYQNGSVVNCSDRLYLQKVLSGSENINYVSNGRMSGDKVFVLAVPVYAGEHVIGAVVATKTLGDISRELESMGEKNKQYNFLCYESGEVVAVPIGNALLIKPGDNIDDYFKGFRDASETQENTVNEYKCGDDEYYGIYTRSALDDIYIFSVADRKYISELAGTYNKLSVALVIVVMFFAFSTTIVIIIRLRRRISIAKTEELERRKKLEKYYEFQSKRSSERADLLGSLHLNLTQNVCIDGKGSIAQIEKFKKYKTVDGLCDALANALYPMDRVRYMEYMSRSAMINAFENGKVTIHDDFLIYNENRYVWLRILINLIRNPITDDLEGLIYGIRINREKRLSQIAKKLIIDEFEGVALIDAISGKVVGIEQLESGEILPEKISNSGVDYDEVAEETLKLYLHNDELDEALEGFSFKKIKAELSANPLYNVTIHIIKGTSPRYYQTEFSYLDSRKESILVICEEITDIVANKIDVMTGLYHSVAFYEEVEEWIKKNPGKKYRIQRYNLDGFRNINGLYGYEEGNKLLRSIGRYMRKRNVGGSFAAHLNSDHFIRFCPEDYMSPEECYKSFLKEFKNYALKYPLSMHVGVYDLCEQDCDSHTMSYKAQLALQSVKGDMSTPIAYYTRGLLQSTKEEQEMLREFDGAIQNKEFEVWFQPQINYANGSLVGAEALVRWRHPKKGLITPLQFIPLFEQSKQITKLDTYVWEETCRYIKHLNDAGIGIPVAVNVSRTDISSCDVESILTDLVNKYEISKKQLRIEITESAYTKDTAKLTEAVEKLKNAGFVIEMDDFGSGYSSLTVLKNLDIDVLKIDLDIVREIGGENVKSNNILKAVAGMTHSLDIAIIAEGVETKTQADYLEAIGCSNMQGYYFGKPMSADEFEKMIKNSKIGKLK